MAKYRKKPVVIDAEQFNGTNIPQGMLKEPTEINGYINTLEGRMTVSIGDFVIKGVNGEFYPCKPDIFEKTYEKVS
jgi:hypothetical protein